MRIIEFSKLFPDEDSCKAHFKSVRDKQGVVCIKCGCKKQYWLNSKFMYQCKDCSFRTSLKKGTILENSNLSIRTWYQIILLISATKKGFSASEIQRQIGLKRYEPVWYCMHKIRRCMGKRDDLYKLADMVELDDAMFKTETSAIKKSRTKRGRGSLDYTPVSVMAESVPLEDLQTGKKSSSCRYFKMKVLNSYNPSDTDQIITGMVNKDSVVFSDKSTSYVNISDFVEIHVSEKSSKETTNKTLKWSHIAISNAKRTFLGVYHKIKGTYLQNYLNEFVYKLNRRYFGEHLFDRLLIAASTVYWQDCG